MTGNPCTGHVRAGILIEGIPPGGHLFQTAMRIMKYKLGLTKQFVPEFVVPIASLSRVYISSSPSPKEMSPGGISYDQFVRVAYFNLPDFLYFSSLWSSVVFHGACACMYVATPKREGLCVGVSVFVRISLNIIIYVCLRVYYIYIYLEREREREREREAERGGGSRKSYHLHIRGKERKSCCTRI